METEISTPPFIPIPGYPTGYPNPARRLGRAWADAWAQLSELKAIGPGYLDGVELAGTTAEAVGLQSTTMVTLFTRAATEGLLEREHRQVVSTRGPRRRTFYRIPQAGA